MPPLPDGVILTNSQKNYPDVTLNVGDILYFCSKKRNNDVTNYE
jgi:hypothetical protein